MIGNGSDIKIIVRTQKIWDTALDNLTVGSPDSDNPEIFEFTESDTVTDSDGPGATSGFLVPYEIIMICQHVISYVDIRYDSAYI